MTLIKLRDTPSDGGLGALTPPIGLWCIRELTPCRVIDENLVDVPELRDDIVGYSLHYPGQEKAMVLRARVNADLEVVGGPHGGLMKTDMTAVWGPGESFFADRRVDFASSPYPHFRGEEMLPYWRAAKPFGVRTSTHRWMPLETSRGCTHACNFCAMPRFWGGWQGKDLAMVDDYLLYLSAHHNINELIILDDNISLKKDRFLRLLEIFNKYAMSWSAPNGIYARGLLDEEVISAILDSGCTALSLPLEAGNPRSAKLMGLGSKYLTYEEARELVGWLRGRVKLTGFFVIGYPGEDEHDVRETLRYANALSLDERYVYFATPYAGTRLHAHAMRHGLLASDPREATYKLPVLETLTLSRTRLYKLWLDDRMQALRRKG
jgi:radical SAM superfamily enzyme YgiQ (UPF0313 family)